ncbi:hypothetical protein GCM10010302_35590 [Streptomyces polychromogenes]|uniref:Uncharacterized protein n=1 Tax=Streptomyces polychromogenes TaxID=67342 RepID=A0ABN0VEX0_9ACTN
MRMRNTGVAALGALALLVTVPTPAAAATGEFEYRYTAPDGTAAYAVLTDPKDDECIDIPEVKDIESTKPANWFYNRTDRSVFVYPEPECGGDYNDYGPGKKQDGFEFRSVSFTAH